MRFLTPERLEEYTRETAEFLRAARRNDAPEWASAYAGRLESLRRIARIEGLPDYSVAARAEGNQ